MNKFVEFKEGVAYKNFQYLNLHDYLPLNKNNILLFEKELRPSLSSVTYDHFLSSDKNGNSFIEELIKSKSENVESLLYKNELLKCFLLLYSQKFSDSSIYETLKNNFTNYLNEQYKLAGYKDATSLKNTFLEYSAQTNLADLKIDLEKYINQFPTNFDPSIPSNLLNFPLLLHVFDQLYLNTQEKNKINSTYNNSNELDALVNIFKEVFQKNHSSYLIERKSFEIGLVNMIFGKYLQFLPATFNSQESIYDQGLLFADKNGQQILDILLNDVVIDCVNKIKMSDNLEKSGSKIKI